MKKIKLILILIIISSITACNKQPKITPINLETQNIESKEEKTEEKKNENQEPEKIDPIKEQIKANDRIRYLAFRSNSSATAKYQDGSQNEIINQTTFLLNLEKKISQTTSSITDNAVSDQPIISTSYSDETNNYYKDSLSDQWIKSENMEAFNVNYIDSIIAFRNIIKDVKSKAKEYKIDADNKQIVYNSDKSDNIENLISRIKILKIPNMKTGKFKQLELNYEYDDNYYPKKLTIKYILEVPAKDEQEQAYTIEQTNTTVFESVNQPIDIQIPSDAIKAN